jgi:hypothetical protein
MWSLGRELGHCTDCSHVMHAEGRHDDQELDPNGLGHDPLIDCSRVETAQAGWGHPLSDVAATHTTPK